MTVKCKVLMNSDREFMLKIISDGSGSFTLERDMLCYKPYPTNDASTIKNNFKFQQPYTGKDLCVSLRAIQWCGEDGAEVVCTRNGEVCFAVCPECTGTVNLSGELGYADNDNEASDLVFTASGSSDKKMQVWVLGRKNNYKSFVETTTQGIFDDETKVDESGV